MCCEKHELKLNCFYCLNNNAYLKYENFMYNLLINCNFGSNIATSNSNIFA